MKNKVNNIPILEGNPMHLIPEMNTILTIKGRLGMDLIHTATRGNRRFAMIKRPELDMRGFILEVKRITPTAVRGEQLVEVKAVERYIADIVFIPEDRRGLYLNDSEALRFANGHIIKDKLPNQQEDHKQQMEVA
jgi:hypothetical protein